MVGFRLRAGSVIGWGMAAALLVAACGGAAEETSTSAGLASGLTCPELAGQVLTYGEAVAYFTVEGEPAALDPDGDGIPCEEDFSPREIGEHFGTTTTAAPTTTTTRVTTTSGAETTTTEPATTTTQASTTTTVPAPVGQFAAFVGGTTPRPCDEDKWPDAPRDDFYFGPAAATPLMERGRIVVFCAFEFDDEFDDGPIDVTVAFPDGSSTSFQALLRGGLDGDSGDDPLAGDTILGSFSDGFQWVVRTNHPLGVYRFAATQGAAAATIEVELRAPTGPRVERYQEEFGFDEEGGPLHFALSGFGPGQIIRLGVYHDATDPFGDENADHEFVLVATLNPVVADAGGAVIAVVEDAGYAPAERHCLATPLIAQPNCDNFRGGWFTP